MLLRPGHTCWRTEKANRVAVLVENAAYFSALRSALANARRSVSLLGWQFDPRTRLDPEDNGGPQGEVGHLLRRLVRERPDLDIRLLIWKSPLPIAISQGFYPQRAQSWFRRRHVEFRLDRPRPFGACHHQKVLVVDDRLAFCGGGDIATDRWDDSAHLDGDPRRCTPSGVICRPRHEVMMMVDGAAAAALGDLARERWRDATGERIRPVTEGSDPWPADVPVDLEDVEVGIARTEPAWRGRAGVRENEALHLEGIARAERLIYLENQYFTSPVIATALAQRLEQPEGPEVVVISTGRSPSWFDQATMDGARAALLEHLRKSDHHGRLSAWSPRTAGGESIVVHSKVTIIDDRILRVGSTNLNNRSSGFDTECDVAIEQPVPEPFIRTLRQRLIAHFLGASLEDYVNVEAVSASVAGAIHALNDAGRLSPIAPEGGTPLGHFIAEYQLGDPSTPYDSWRPWRRYRLTRMLRAEVAEIG